MRRKRADFREAGATIACHLLVAATLPMSWPHYMYNGVEAFAASGVHHRCAHVVERFATGDESRSSRAASWCPIDDGKRLACAARTHIQKITMKDATIFDLLTMPGAGDIDFDPPRFGDESIRPADFS